MTRIAVMAKNPKALLQNISTRPELFFLIISLIFGVVFVFTNPPFFGLDERAHFLRTYEIGHGEFGVTTVNKHLGTKVPENLAQLVNVSTNDLLDSKVNSVGGINRKDADKTLYKPFLHETFSHKYIDDKASNTQLLGTYAYNPVSYLYFGLVERIGELFNLSILHTIYLVRLMNLLLYVAIVYISIKLANRWGWVIVVVSLLPVAIFQASTISVDPIINALAFLLFSTYIYIRSQKKLSTTHINVLGLAIILLASLLGLLKLPYLILILPFLTVQKTLFKNSQSRYVWKTILLIVPITVGLIWSHVNSATVNDIVKVLAVGDYDAQVSFVTSHPLHFLETLLRTYYHNVNIYFNSMVGEIGDMQVGLKSFLLALFFIPSIMFAGLLGNKSSRGTVDRRGFEDLIILITCVSIITLISAGLYAVFNPVGAEIIGGIQGRYFLPLIPFLVIPLTRYLPIKIANEKLAIISIELSSIALLFSTAVIYFIANY